MFWKYPLSKKVALEYELSCIIRKESIFPENMILFFRRKMEDDLSQKINENMIFSVYSVYINPRKCGVSSEGKTKDDKKVYFY